MNPPHPLNVDAIVELDGTDIERVFVELCTPIANAESVATDELVAALREREQLASTAVGHGVAMPHGVHPGLSRVVASFGRSRSGLDLGAPDGVRVHLFVALVRPPDAAGSHLNALARWSRLLASDPVREALLAAPTVEEIRRILDTPAR